MRDAEAVQAPVSGTGSAAADTEQGAPARVAAAITRSTAPGSASSPTETVTGTGR